MSNDDSCMLYQDLLPTYGTGHLGGVERELVDRHLAGCENCRGEVAQWRAIGDALSKTHRAIPPAPAQDQFWQLVRSRLPETATTPQIQPHLNGAQTTRRGMSDMATDTEELVFEEMPSHATPPRNPLIDPSRRRRSLPAIAATLFIVVLGVVLFVVIVPGHPATSLLQHGTPTAALTPVPTAIHTSTPEQTLPVNEGGVTLEVTNVYGAFVAGPGNAWVGNDNAISHFANNKWTSYSLNNGGVVYGLAMTSATDGWAVGGEQQGSIPLMLHFTNGVWHRVTLPFSGEGLAGIQMSSANEGWAWGRNVLLHYSNHQWQSVTVGFAIESIIICGFAATASSEAWLAACNNSQLQLWHLHSGQWSAGPTFANLTMNPAASNLSMASSVEGWAATTLLNPGKRLSATGPMNPVILHYHNGRWAQENPDPNDLSVQKYFIDGIYLHGNQGWATLFSENPSLPNAALHEINGHWSFASIPPNLWIHQIAITGSGEAWAVGESNNPPRTAIVAHYLNGSWSIVDPA